MGGTDAKDILGLPKTPLPLSHEKKARPQKESHRKPDGISREVYALTGGVAPLMPSIDVTHLKRPPPPDEKVAWQWLPIKSSARKDDLQLYHWVISSLPICCESLSISFFLMPFLLSSQVRVVNGVPPTADYSFAKYNKSVDISKYTDDEYENHLTDPVWTKEETDQLFELCERFDLRFTLIADRFPLSRTLEELKDRYYTVTRALLRARAQSPADLANHPLMKEPYDMTRDRERKRALSMVLSQSRHQEKKDAEILAEAKRITEMRLAARRAAGPDVSGNENIALDKADGGPASPSSNSQLPATAVAPSTLTMADYASTLASLRMLHVYLRTYGLEQMVQAASSAVGLRTIKRVEQTLQDLGVNLKPKVPTKTVCDEHLELRKEILTLLNLQKQLQYKESEGSSQREGSYAAMPDTPKDRVFASEPFSFGGISAEKPIKKEPKRKGPGRQADTPSPAHKRPRKLKASDL
ncbi:SWR1-complex protein 4 isoform X1 [Brassica rapa]|uniref:SWR1-complex protein 4 isoform X1 n=1 Tax=Brassica campestris TaxID=3711 RepID=UPI0004F1A41C|nr:SWR1-complex protein 4 isoform X1 [Brassica rapa]